MPCRNIVYSYTSPGAPVLCPSWRILDAWNTTSTLLLSHPSLKTLFGAALAKSLGNVLSLPSISIYYTGWLSSRSVSATGTRIVSHELGLVSFSKWHISINKGPWYWTEWMTDSCFISSSLLWATTIMCTNKLLSAFNTILFPIHLPFWWTDHWKFSTFTFSLLWRRPHSTCLIYF